MKNKRVISGTLSLAKVPLTIDEAAKYLCVSRSKLMKMCHLRELKYCKAGRLNVFFEEDLRDYLINHRVLTIDDAKQQAETKLLNLKNRG